MIAGFASVLGKQARGTVLLEATQQTKHLTPLQADQHTGVSNTQTTRLNPQQHLKPAELLLAHRQHRQGAPPGTPEPGGVSPLSCRGVSSLYCAYILWQHIRDYVLVKDTTKTGQEASIDFKLYPLALAELQRVPLDQRVGPVIINSRT